MIHGTNHPVRSNPNPLPAPSRVPPSGSTQGSLHNGIAKTINGFRPVEARGTPQDKAGTGGGSGGGMSLGSFGAGGAGGAVMIGG